MRKVFLLMFLLPLMAVAQTVTSPNGNIIVTFSLTGNGRPTYEMTYKGKVVVKPSFLGLELAKDKHASEGLHETDLMDGFENSKTEHCLKQNHSRESLKIRRTRHS